MVDVIARAGILLIFAVVFLNQLGLPVPGALLVIAFGALAGRGAIEPLSGLAVATAASLCADLLWFQLGRRMGARVLALVCRISLEPDSCVARTRDTFGRHGVRSLLVAKFVPGLSTVAPPLAGMLGVGIRRFLLWSTAGALLWLVTFGGLGYLFSDRIEALTTWLEGLGSMLGVVLVGFLAAYAGWKYLGRWQVLHRLRMARISPEELHGRILAGEEPVIVDVRQGPALEALPFTLPGALLVTLEELDRRHHEIPHDRDIVLYCS